ncbi:unnamed protein product [Ectocarpus fasciculatus]
MPFFQAVLRERLLIADSLAEAHSDYAKSVSRYQSSIFDNVSGGPPPEVVLLGDRVVGASDAFAEAHGRAEEVLTKLLEERGRCLRETASSLKAAQAGFFVRASRCVSSSVVWESTDDVLSRATGDLQHTTRSTAEDTSKPHAASHVAKPKAVAVSTDAAFEGGKEERDGGAAGSEAKAIFSTGIHDRDTVKGKWRKGGDYDGLRNDSSKRRRNSGWFKRLASSFQTNRPRSASEELLEERMPSPFNDNADEYDSGGDDDKKLCLRSIPRAAASSAKSPKGKLLFGGEDFWDGNSSLRNGNASELATEAAATSSPDAGDDASATGAVADSDSGGGGGGGSGVEPQVETEGEDTDYETGSNTTEGFGSDDAGDLWDGRRSTLMGTLDRTSFMPNDHGHKSEEEEEWHVPPEEESNGDEPEGGDSGGKGVGSPSGAEEEEGVELMPGAHPEVGIAEMLKEEDGASRSGINSPASDVEITVPPAVENERTPEIARSVKDGQDRIDEEHDGGRGGGRVKESGDSGTEGAKAEDISSPVPTRRSPYLVHCSPSRAPPSMLPVLPEPGTTQDVVEDPLPPVAIEQRRTPSPLSKFTASPAISDVSSCKESPRAWRLSWWAKASDRHPPPPPPNDDGDNEEAGGGTGTSFAAALAAAAGGEKAAAAALSAGGAFAPSRNAGDAPAVMDGGEREASLEEALKNAATGTVAEAASERRSRRRWTQRRREKPWLSKDKLADPQTRALEAASEYLDVVALAKAGVVCRAWRQPLAGEEGRQRWMRCVRLADGVPENRRAMFYLHILYDQPSWVKKAHGSQSSERPRPGVYQECLEKAEADQEETVAAKEMQRVLEEEERNGRASPSAGASATALFRDSGGIRAVAGGRDGDGDTPAPPPRFHKWLEEIETDVLRTCPGDDAAGEDAVNEFDSALSKNTAAASDGGEMGDTGTPPPANESSRVRFSVSFSSFGSSSSTVKAVGNSSSSGAVAEDLGSDGRKPSTAPGGQGRNSAPTEGEEIVAGVRGGSGAIVRNKFSATGGGMRDKLRRVLRAFAVYNRRVSYCQGMNFVALALLEACEGDDENAFWILAGMCENLELGGLWCQGLERLDLCFFSLERLLRRHCPSLRQHLSDEGVELSMFTSRWFVTLFTSTDVFGRGTSRKILDMFLVEGWPLLFKMSLGVLLEMRPLLEPADMEGILKVTKFPRAHLFGLRRDGSGRHIAGASFEEATQGSLCESIRAGQMVEHALLLHISEETLEQHQREYRLQKHAAPGSD